MAEREDIENTGAGSNMSDATLGEMLRRAREQRDLSVNDLANCLKLEPRTLEWLEQDAYDKLPPPAFVRGYLRAIAKEFGVDSAPFIAVFELHNEHEAPELSDFKSRAPIQITSESHLVRYTTIGLSLLMVVLVSLWWQSHRRDSLDVDELVEPDMLSEAPSPASDPLPYSFDVVTHPDESGYGAPLEADDSAVTRVGADLEAAIPAAADSTAAEGALTVAAAEPAAEESPAPATVAADEAATEAAAVAAARAPSADDAAAAPTGAADIVVTTSENAWLDVKDASGRRLYFDFARPARPVRLNGQAPYALVVGNSPAVKIEFRGQPVDVESHAREGVARFELGR